MSGVAAAERFARAAERLRAVLGPVTAGGALEGLAHIGATSVPELAESAVVDIALAVWPFPLAGAHLAALAALGYRLDPPPAGASEQRFQHPADRLQLWVSEPGSRIWQAHLVLRDYLRASPEARAHYRAAAAAGPAAKAAHLAAQRAPAEAWWTAHHGFTPLEAVAAELRGLAAPWLISSGWALDLFLGAVTRVHHDVDVVLPRADQFALRAHLAARGWEFVTPLAGRLEAWPAHMRLELPRHQIHAHRADAFIDILLTDWEPDLWVYRRNPAVVRRRDRAVLAPADGVPCLAPELVLLFKSQNTSGKERTQDQQDFERVWPALEPERRAWLRWALTATAPEHPWLTILA